MVPDGTDSDQSWRLSKIGRCMASVRVWQRGDAGEQNEHAPGEVEEWIGDGQAPTRRGAG